MLKKNDFTVYDGEGAKWLSYKGKDFDNAGGEASLFLASGPDKDKALTTLKISGVVFAEAEAEEKDDNGFFSAIDGDKKTKMKWTITRSVEVFDKGSGPYKGNKVGELTCSYKGIAEAKKDVDYNVESCGDTTEVSRDVEWKSWARAQDVEYKMTIEGKDVPVSMSPGADGVSMWEQDSDWQWGQTYQCGPFEVEYQEKMGADNVVIKTQGKMNPVISVPLGFTLAYWMHPKRVEDDAAEKALKVLQARVGTTDIGDMLNMVC